MTDKCKIKDCPMDLSVTSNYCLQHEREVVETANNLFENAAASGKFNGNFEWLFEDSMKAAEEWVSRLYVMYTRRAEEYWEKRNAGEISE